METRSTLAIFIFGILLAGFNLFLYNYPNYNNVYISLLGVILFGVFLAGVFLSDFYQRYQRGQKLNLFGSLFFTIIGLSMIFIGIYSSLNVKTHCGEVVDDYIISSLGKDVRYKRYDLKTEEGIQKIKLSPYVKIGGKANTYECIRGEPFFSIWETPVVKQ